MTGEKHTDIGDARRAVDSADWAVWQHPALVSRLLDELAERREQAAPPALAVAHEYAGLVAMLAAAADRSPVKSYVSIDFKWDASTAPFERAELTLYRKGATVTTTARLTALEDLVADLSEIVKTIDRGSIPSVVRSDLDRRVEEALRVRRAAPKPRDERCACDGSFRTAEDFRDHLPCGAVKR